MRTIAFEACRGKGGVEICHTCGDRDTAPFRVALPDGLTHVELGGTLDREIDDRASP
jgi:hypothetical protein